MHFFSSKICQTRSFQNYPFILTHECTYWLLVAAATTTLAIFRKLNGKYHVQFLVAFLGIVCNSCYSMLLVHFCCLSVWRFSETRMPSYVMLLFLVDALSANAETITHRVTLNLTPASAPPPQKPVSEMEALVSGTSQKVFSCSNIHSPPVTWYQKLKKVSQHFILWIQYLLESIYQ